MRESDFSTIAQLGTIKVNKPPSPSDRNDNGRIDLANLVWLFIGI